MRIWLITVGEPLPIDKGKNRLLRTGMLANLLVRKGHDVVWWTSDFDHSKKKHRCGTDTSIDVSHNYTIKLLHSISYKKNISINRLINHYIIAHKFIKLAEVEIKPDIILCSFPTIELSLSAVGFGKKGIPVIIDIRDLWPDIFIDLFPAKLKCVAKCLMYVLFKNTAKVFKSCTSIISISEGYLQWGLKYANRPQGPHDTLFVLGYQEPSVSDGKLKEAEANIKRLGIDTTKIICWFIGAFGKTYDLDTVISAARYLQQQGVTNVQFVLSGDGENYSQWLSHSEGLENIVFTGWVDSAHVAYLMRIADIGLMAYAEGAPQGLPNKIFEYLCAGLPILSSLGGETEDLLTKNHCGLTYRPGDSQSFLSILQVLINDEDLRKKMSLNGRKLFIKNYSAENVYSEMAYYLEGLTDLKAKP